MGSMLCLDDIQLLGLHSWCNSPGFSYGGSPLPGLQRIASHQSHPLSSSPEHTSPLHISQDPFSLDAALDQQQWGDMAGGGPPPTSVTSVQADTHAQMAALRMQAHFNAQQASALQSQLDAIQAQLRTQVHAQALQTAAVRFCGTSPPNHIPPNPSAATLQHAHQVQFQCFAGARLLLLKDLLQFSLRCFHCPPSGVCLLQGSFPCHRRCHCSGVELVLYRRLNPVALDNSRTRGAWQCR